MRLMMGCHDNLNKIGPENEERGRNLRGESNGNGGVFERPTRTTSEGPKRWARVSKPAQEKKNKGEARALIWMEGRLPVAAGGGRGEPEHTRQHLEPGPVKFKEAGPLHTIKTLIPQKSADADAFTGGCSTNGSAETA